MIFALANSFEFIPKECYFKNPPISVISKKEFCICADSCSSTPNSVHNRIYSMDPTGAWCRKGCVSVCGAAVVMITNPVRDFSSPRTSTFATSCHFTSLS